MKGSDNMKDHLYGTLSVLAAILVIGAAGGMTDGAPIGQALLLMAAGGAVFCGCMYKLGAFEWQEDKP